MCCWVSQAARKRKHPFGDDNEGDKHAFGCSWFVSSLKLLNVHLPTYRDWLQQSHCKVSFHLDSTNDTRFWCYHSVLLASWIYFLTLEDRMPKKCGPLRCEAHFQVEMCKAPQIRTTFGSSDVEKLRGAKYMSKWRVQWHPLHLNKRSGELWVGCLSPGIGFVNCFYKACKKIRT